MFPWQVECLANKKILLDNKNLVYSAPTSAGKTLVSELLILKTVLERRKKVIFILPFVSVVREKMFYLQDLLSDSGVRVEGFMGGVAPAGGFQSVHIAIATIEKANSLINRLMQDGDLDTLGAVVIDELHLLGDPGRGYILELLLTKLKYMSDSFEHIDIQLIGMSATLPNLPLIAEWLNAELYHTDFRPIPLEERCKIGLSIMNKEFNLVEELTVAPDIIDDLDNVIQLCIETISTGRGTLIFCPTKNWCEKLAVQMAATFFQPFSFGVAFHHAGLTMDERDIIEGAFRTGSLKVLVATSTLSSGVNLPARRVIIRSPMFNGNVIDKLTYQQMIGRAGRMGKDTAGESILICKNTERSVAEKLIKSTLEPIKSCLKSSGPLIRALLEAIASQVVKTPADLDRYSKCTFVYKCEDSGVKSMVEEAVEFLVANEFLLVKNANDNNEEQRMMATCLGKACLSASIPPRDALFLFEELQRARKCFVLDTELHVVYLVTPFNSSGQINQIDWMSFMEQWRKLSESERRVGNLVGVEERFIMSAMRGIIKSEKALSIHRRFFTALALHDLVREVPLNAVCRKYNCSRGLLQSLQQSSATFSGMVTSFCKELKWDCMELLFAQFQTRLQFGVQRELLDLLRLPSINGLRARSLFKQGITTVGELVLASEIEIEEALEKALPFESEKDFDGGNKAEVEKKMKMRTIFITGKDGLTAREAARIVINEARLLVKNELGLQDVKWSQNNDEGSSPTSPASSCFSPTAEAISLQPLSLIQEVTPQQPNTCINAKEEENNFDSKVKTGAIEAQTLDKSMKFTENNDAKQVTVELQNKLSLGHVDNRFSGDLISQDIINESDKEQPEKSTRTLRSRLTSKNKSVQKSKTVTNMTIFTVDFQDDLDSYFVESSQNTGMTLKSKINAQTARIVEKMESLKKSKQISICSVDFQDSKMDGESVLQKVSKVNDDITVENINFTENSLSKNPPFNQKKCLKLNSNIQTKNVTLSSRNLRSRTIDIIESDDNHRVTHNEILKVENQKSDCKVELENNLVSIRSIDFQDSDIKQIKPTKQDSEEFRVESFLNMSSGALNELLKSTDKKTDDADIFQKPTTLLNYTPKVKEKKRESASSINSSKSMSLFSDSSFLDAQICSVLEKNVIEGSCLIDFENSEFSQNQRKSQNVPSTNSQSKEKNSITSSQKISNINAVEELLFSPRKFRTFSNEKGSSTQQQIRRTEDDQSKNIRTEGDKRVTKKTIIESDSKENSPTVTRSKYIFARKSDEQSPIAGIRSYNKRVPIKTAVGSRKSFPFSGKKIQFLFSKGCFTGMLIQHCFRNKYYMYNNSLLKRKDHFPIITIRKKNGRIHSQCITYTVTGRISMHEPNLQTIPRDFKSDISGYVLSPRMAFIPSEGNIMLSADFCQLELRILAHFSKDPVLYELMLQENGDIFKNIAARLNNVAEEMVDDDMRQRAKQLCYAMIYGMGAKSLAETLSISESEAKDYLEMFMSTYKGIKSWLKSIAEQARIDGFVNTITGRKRVLPNINSNVAAIKSQAERQAVNTKVQGSAADIAKKAMVLIEDQIRKHFSCMPITPLKFPSSKKKLEDNSDKATPNGGFLILQLHDELIYEVNPNDLPVIAKIVKESMERAFKLRVPLPVKVKIGTAWGNLEEYKV
ncbi:unnamed protein product [Trichogramma brassicae]|uniref:DNA-directed DNA polymerase n=1 Tax=Trichogramma brassicae TaxID=86971 RepID=A0A6H5IDF3_9HYME|nr:unnamed protein product [Trichogramma brassicae]